MCPAGTGHVMGTGASQGQEPSGTGKVQVQGALAAWLCQHPSPQHSPARAVPSTGIPVHPLPLELCHHTTDCHLHSLHQGSVRPHIHPTACLGDQPAALWGYQPVPAALPTPPSSPSQGLWQCKVLPGTGRNNSEGVQEHRDKQGSALQHSQRLGTGDNCPALECRFAQEKNKDMRFSSLQSVLFCPT